MKYSSAIYHTYLADDATMPINVDYIVLKTIKKYLKSPNVNMFDMAQRQVRKIVVNRFYFDCNYSVSIHNGTCLNFVAIRLSIY